MGKLKRPRQMLFIGIPTTSSGTTTYNYKLAGVYSDDLSISYNPVTEESQDVTEVASSTDVTGYGINVSVSTKAVAVEGQKGYALFNYINTLRKTLAVANDATTKVILVDAYNGTATDIDLTAASFEVTDAQKFDATIQIDSYGGPANESLGIDYTVNINGEPVTVAGTVAMDTTTKDRTFTEKP